jgi:hypothetical protein
VPKVFGGLTGPPNIVLIMPTYNRTFILKNISNRQIGPPLKFGIPEILISASQLIKFCFLKIH